jgi:hypothetical protein
MGANHQGRFLGINLVKMGKGTDKLAHPAARASGFISDKSHKTPR